jgi:roadblock/LC7 domain-containing protein
VPGASIKEMAAAGEKTDDGQVVAERVTILEAVASPQAQNSAALFAGQPFAAKR